MPRKRRRSPSPATRKQICTPSHAHTASLGTNSRVTAALPQSCCGDFSHSYKSRRACTVTAYVSRNRVCLSHLPTALSGKQGCLHSRPPRVTSSLPSPGPHKKNDRAKNSILPALCTSVPHTRFKFIKLVLANVCHRPLATIRRPYLPGCIRLAAQEA